MSVESYGGMTLTGKIEELGEKPVPEPFFPPKIPYGPIRTRTRASAFSKSYIQAAGKISRSVEMSAYTAFVDTYMYKMTGSRIQNLL
jgi:hypothetical protein